MLKFAMIVLVALTFVLPIVAVLLIVDRNKKSIIPLLLGGILYTILEACIILPAINYLGYNIFSAIVGIIIIEVLRYLVLKIYLNRAGQSAENIMCFFAGYVLVDLFIVWGIDALATALVVFLSEYGLTGPGDIWISIVMAVIKVVMIYSYTTLIAIAVKKKKTLYVLAAVGLHIVSDENIIFEICSMLDINNSIGIMLLVVIACIMFVVNDTISHLWKGNGNENQIEH